MPGPRPAPRARLDLSLYLITDTAMCELSGPPGVVATVTAAVAAGYLVVNLIFAFGTGRL